MAGRVPDDDPRVTDLQRYRKAREQARKRAETKAPAGPSPESLLGANPRAGLILALVALVLLALYVLPKFL